VRRSGSGKVRGAACAALLAVGLLAGACNSDADSGDTRPQNNTDNPSGDQPGGIPGGSDPEGEGTGTGRGDETP
jgi:hypothetical protein